jgi:hypothetical protein
MDRDSREFALYLGALAFLIIVIIFLWLIPAKALAPEYAASWSNELNYLILKKPPYVWGAATYEAADCSGYLYATARAAGMPVLRTTAKEMAAGNSGWLGKTIDIDSGEELSVIFWTWSNKPDRPHGHVGALLLGKKTGLLMVTHASPTRKGVVLDQLKGKLITDISRVRHLTIGDKK